MFGRKHTTAALVATLGLVAFIGGCRGEATTGSSNIPSSEFASGLRLQTGDVQSGPLAQALPQALTVRVVDAGGLPVQGASVTWSVLTGGGTVNPPTGVSNAQGLVSTTWTLGPALGPNTVRAYLTRGYNLDSASFSATAIVGPAVLVTLDSTALPPATAVVGAPVTIRYKVKDAFGNPVVGATVNFAAAVGSGTVSPASAVSDANGLVSTTWTTPGTIGTRTVTASLASGSVVNVSLTTTPAASRVLTNAGAMPSPGLAGSTLASPIIVRVADAFGNPIAGAAVNFAAFVPAGVTVTPTSATTDVTGAAQATIRLGNVLGVDTVRVSVAGGNTIQYPITATMTFRDIFAGNYFACAVGTNDRAYCWGFGEDGQLGNGVLANTSAARLPVSTTANAVVGPYPTFRELVGGRSHTCGVGVGRTLFCWGLDVEGRQFAPASGPTRRSFAVESPTVAVSNARLVTAGEAHSCMLTMGGVAYCSGNNERGQLGNGSAGVGAIAVQPDSAGGRPSSYSGIATGERHTCGIPRLNPGDLGLAAGVVRPSQRVWCWGANNSGQLGNGTFRDTSFADTVKIPALLAVVGFDSTSLVAGASHSCALEAGDPATDRRAFCWGNNSFGQLGKGAIDTLAHNTMRQVVGQMFVRLYAGENHTCGLNANGQAFCWGRNDRGQLNGTISAPQSTPLSVGGAPYRALALGELFTCGILGQPGPSGTTSGASTIQCWGDNEFGQLGRGFFDPSAHTPRPPAGIFGQ